MTLSGPVLPLLACAMLVSMRAQLPRLRGLTLTLEHPEDWLAAEDVHRELGDMTQLTQLCLNLKDMQVSSLDGVGVSTTCLAFAKQHMGAALTAPPCQLHLLVCLMT